MADETSKFTFKIDADAEPTAEATAELEKFRASIEKSQSAIANYRKSQGLLRGSSDEVTAAKAALKGAIAAEQQKITSSNLSILKLNGSYDKLSKAHKKATDSSNAGKKAVSAIGGPVKDISDRFESLKGILGGVSSGWGLVSVAALAGVAALAAGTIAAGGLIAKLTEFVAVSADSLRNLGLMREAVSGNEKNATAWGHTIDWLSLKLATSKDDLNEMVVGLEKSLRGTRVSGTGMVNVFQAVANASAAMGKDTGKALEDILTRGKNTGRFWLGFKAPGISELQGTGITFEQVAGQLAKDLNIGTAQAKSALLRGAVTMDQGAKAVREVTEGRFADINAKKLLSLDSLWTKFKDNIRDFASDAAKEGGALEPVLKGLKAVVDMFGLQSESGQNTKKVVTEYANALSAGFVRALPVMKQIVSTGLSIVGWIIDAVSAVVRFSQTTTGLILIKSALAGIAVVVGLVAVSFLPLVVAVAAAGAAFAAVGAAFYGLYAAGKALVNLDWAGIGESIVDGIIGGISNAWDHLKSAVTTMGQGIKNEFKHVLGISSPSKAFQGYGVNTAQGYTQGIASAEPQVTKAGSSMAQAVTVGARNPEVSVSAPMPSAAASSAGGSQSGGVTQITNEFHYQVNGNASDPKTLEALKQSTVDGVQLAIRLSLKGAGIPTGVPMPAGG